MRKYWVLSLLFAFLLIGSLSLPSCDDDDDDNDDDVTDDDDAAGDDDNDATDDDSGDDDDDDDDDDNDDDDDDVSDETWTDSTTGLTWQVTPLNDYLNWNGAKEYCQNLSLDGGGWRLPTITELRSLLRGCEATITGGTCGVHDGCAEFGTCFDGSCIGCDLWGGPGTGGAFAPTELSGTMYRYWSSSTVPDVVDSAWCVDFSYGQIGVNETDYNNFARCVRP